MMCLLLLVVWTCFHPGPLNSSRSPGWLNHLSLGWTLLEKGGVFFSGFGKRIFFFLLFFGEASPLSSFFLPRLGFVVEQVRNMMCHHPEILPSSEVTFDLKPTLVFCLAKDKPPSPDGKTPGSKEAPCGGWLTYQTHRLDHQAAVT